jgi:hypothetical protein
MMVLALPKPDPENHWTLLTGLPAGAIANGMGQWDCSSIHAQAIGKPGTRRA